MMVFYWRLPYDSLYHLRRVYSASYAYILDYHRSNVDLVCHSIFCSYNFLKNSLQNSNNKKYAIGLSISYCIFLRYFHNNLKIRLTYRVMKTNYIIIFFYRNRNKHKSYITSIFLIYYFIRIVN